MEFQDKLKKLRLEKGLSQQALADAIYVSRSAVAKWENGLGWPGESSLEVLTAYFGVDGGYFRTEEPDAVIIAKNRRIRRLRLVLELTAVLVLGAVLLIASQWFGSVAEQDLSGLAAQAADYLRQDGLEIIRTTRRGDFLAALCRTPEGRWSLCVFDRSPVFRERWVASGGKRAFDSGRLTSWNYGSPRDGAVLVFCGGDLSPEIAWYTFENSGIYYTCPVENGQVLDLFIIPDSHNINGTPVPLNSEMQPVQ